MVLITPSHLGSGEIGFAELGLTGVKDDASEDVRAYAAKLAALRPQEAILIVTPIVASVENLLLPVGLGAGEYEEDAEGYTVWVQGGTGNFGVEVSNQKSDFAVDEPVVRILSNMEDGKVLRVGTGKSIGSAKIKLTDRANRDNSASVVIKVRELDVLVFQPSQKQTPFTGQEVLVPVYARAARISSEDENLPKFFDSCANFLPTDVSVEPQRIARFAGVNRNAVDQGSVRSSTTVCGNVVVHPLTTGSVTLSFLEKKLGSAMDISFFDPIKVEFESILGAFQPPALGVPADDGGARELLNQLSSTSAVAEIGAEILLKFSRGPPGISHTQNLEVADSVGGGQSGEEEAEKIVDISRGNLGRRTSAVGGGLCMRKTLWR